MQRRVPQGVLAKAKSSHVRGHIMSHNPILLLLHVGFERRRPRAETVQVQAWYNSHKKSQFEEKSHLRRCVGRHSAQSCA